MTLFDVLALAAQLGVLLGVSPDGEHIKLTPAGRASDELRAGVREHKEELLTLLRKERAPPAAMLGPPARHALRAPNTTPTPDVLFDELAPSLNEGELRVILYLIRRTYGFRKAGDRVSLSQFADGVVTREGKRLDHGTGMSRRGVMMALASLEARGLVGCERSAAGRAGHGTNRYTLHILHEGPEAGEHCGE